VGKDRRDASVSEVFVRFGQGDQVSSVERPEVSDKFSYTCAGCLHPFEPKCWQDGETAPPDFGIFLPIGLMGYYCGFTDHLLEETAKAEVWVCHDCWVKVMEVLPGLSPYMIGGHPGEHTEPPCCDYAWTTDSATLTQYTAIEGEWVVDVPATDRWRKQDEDFRLWRALQAEKKIKKNP
jgi:hypothetical protein